MGTSFSNMTNFNLSQLVFDKPRTIQPLLEALCITLGRCPSQAGTLQVQLTRNSLSVQNELERVDDEGIDELQYEKLRDYVNSAALDERMLVGKMNASHTSARVAAWIRKVYVERGVLKDQVTSSRPSLDYEMVEFFKTR